MLDDAIMPAVDYRTPDGLSFGELSEVLRAAIVLGRAVGMTIAIFNPALDPDGTIAASLVRCLADGLTGYGER